MKKILILGFLVLAFFQINAQKNALVNAFNYIINDTLLNRDSAINLTKKENSFFVSEEIVPFDLLSVKTSILRDQYINNFDPFASYTGSDLELIRKVNDSLIFETKELNKYFIENKINDQVLKSKYRDIKYVVFFTKIVKGNLYAEVYKYNVNTNRNFSRKNISYGKFYSYLFILTNDKIIKVYNGNGYND